MLNYASSYFKHVSIASKQNSFQIESCIMPTGQARIVSYFGGHIHVIDRGKKKGSTKCQPILEILGGHVPKTAVSNLPLRKQVYGNC